MPEPAGQIQAVGGLMDDLRALGLAPVLVGGMALVVRGSRRVDLLFDFPIEAAALASRATRTKIQSHVFAIASDEDLLELKTIAAAARSAPGDAEDIAFLQARLRTQA